MKQAVPQGYANIIITADLLDSSSCCNVHQAGGWAC